MPKILIKIEKKYCKYHKKVCIFITVKVPLLNIDWENEHLPSFLANEFYNHGKFYKIIGFKDNGNYHIYDHDFSERCSGFRDFMREFFGKERLNELEKEHLNLIAKSLYQYFATKIKEKIDAFNTYQVITISHQPDIDKLKLTDNTRIQYIFKRKPVIYSEDGIYKIEFTKISEDPLKDLPDKIMADAEKIYRSQITAIKNSYENEINKLQQQMKKEKQKAFLSGMKFVAELQQNKFEFDINGNYIIFRYGEPIYAEIIQKKGNTFIIPKENQKLFYISDLKIYVDISTLKISEAYCGEGYHPNVDGKKCCLGELEGADFSQIYKVPSMYKLINLDSAFNNNAYEDAISIVNKIEKEGGIYVWE